MKRLIVLALCAGVALAACEKQEVGETATEAPASEMVAPAEEDAAAPAPAPEAENVEVVETPAPKAGARTAPPQTRAPVTPANIPLLAYKYLYRIEAPAKSIDLLMSKHEAACLAAGPAVCQITNADLRRESERRITGTLSLRARPDWLAGFRAELASDAEGVGGKISTSNTGTDDLSASIVDTEAAIRAKVILRDRLEDIMAHRTGKLSDVMDAEQQLAEVRSEIDAAQSSLAMMKNRVRMSSLTIEYGPKGSLASDGAWTPVGQAVRGAQDVMAQVISVLILLMAGLAPIAALVAGIWWGVRRLRKPAPAPSA